VLVAVLDAPEDALPLAEQLAFPGVSAVGGSWLIEPALIWEGRFGGIERLVRQAVAFARG
jgi:2-keto-3-deoxy-6-phosphogluconate aldolase